jgi:hypothetical protein
LTPIPIPINLVPEVPIEEKVIEIPVESVFMWQKKVKDKDEEKIEEVPLLPSNKKRYRRR